jgi:hypothetical protein
VRTQLSRAIALAACLAAVPVCAMAAPADTGNAAKADDFEAYAAAREMLTTIGFEKNLEEAMVRMGDLGFTEGLATSERKHGITFPAELRDELRRLVAVQIHEMADELKKTALDDAARIYAKYFTAQEIRELQEIQRRPVMVKANKIMPAMQTELAAIGMRAAAARQPAIKQKVKETVEQWFEKNRDKVKKS